MTEMKNIRLISGWLILCLLVILAIPGMADDRREERTEIRTSEHFRAIPDLLRFSQKEGQKQSVKSGFYTRHLLPETASARVNEKITTRVLAMEEEGKAEMLKILPKGQIEAGLETGAQIYRTGTKIMSFLIQCSGLNDPDLLYSQIESYTYDMETGKEIKLEDLFPEDSSVWDLLSQGIREQLNAYYPAEEADPTKLDALCAKENLLKTPMNLTTGRIVFHFKTAQLYHNPVSYMHAEFYYPELREYMTDFAREQTDNSHYRLAALTFDDGPPKGKISSSIGILKNLVKYGASCTFFIVGDNTRFHPGIVERLSDHGMEIASHSYMHELFPTADQASQFTDKMDETMEKLVGKKPMLFRAPGGNFKNYIKVNADKVMIRWNIISGDVDGEKTDYDVITTVGGRTNAGDIVLCHDVFPNVKMLEQALPMIENRNVLLVTVSEMMSVYGFKPEKNAEIIDLTDTVLEMIR